MKKVLIGVAGVLGVAVVGFVGAVMMQPDTTHVERSVVVAASPADVFPYINDHKLQEQWSPWADRDPDQKVEFSEPSHGKDAWYSWDGNDEVGAGKLTTVESVENQKTVQALAFTRPFESNAEVALILTPDGEGTKVTWTFDTENDFMGKMAGMFMDMDAMLGADYEAGLAKLQPLAEEAAKERVAAEQKAEEEARLAAEAAEAGEGAEGAEDGAAEGSEG